MCFIFGHATKMCLTQILCIWPIPSGATLTFKDVHYTVKASTSNDKLELLKGVTGYFASGKMTALMGSSGKYSL